MEQWKQIEGFNGCYYVSNTGKVKSKGKTGFSILSGAFTFKELILTPSKTNWGHLRVVLQLNKKRKHVRVHRLVAQYFLPNLLGKSEVNHIDGDKTNNNVDNLEWVTPKENFAHSVKANIRKDNKGVKGFKK